MFVIAAEASDTSAVEQLGAWVVPGLIALVGVALGKLWERGSSDFAWWREQRLAAYAELVDATLRLANGAAVQASHRVDELEREVQVAHQRVRILGPETVEDRAERMVWKASVVASGPGDSEEVILAELAIDGLEGGDDPAHTLQIARFTNYLDAEQTFIEIAQTALERRRR